MKNNITTLTEFEPSMFADTEGPLVSVFVKTHRHSSEHQQEETQYKVLVAEAENILAKEYSQRDYSSLIGNLRELLDSPDKEVWRAVKEGLAVLASNDGAFIYHLDYPVENQVFVANSYHIKPLIRNFQYGSHYYLLALSADRFTLYYGDFHSFEKVTLPDKVVDTFDELFSDFDNITTITFGNYGGLKTLYHGHYDKGEVAERDTVKFFRYVDRVLYKHYVSEHSCPIILVSLPQHQIEFRGISTLPTLLDAGIDKPFESMPEPEVLSSAKEIITALQEATLKRHLDNYGLASSRGQASSDPNVIAGALTERKLAALFVSQEVSIPGRYNKSAGTFIEEQLENALVDDVTDDFAQAAYLQGGEVYAIEKDRIPSENGVAALFRY